MRRHVLLLALGLACGCGGGAGGAGDALPAGDPPPQVSADGPSLQEVLQGCSTQNVQDAIAFVQSLAALLPDPATQGTEPPVADWQGFAVTGFDLISLSISWELDADVDGTPEVQGTLRFADAAGRPTLPFDVQDLLGGLPPVDTLLADLPDGTHALMTFDLLRFVEGTGNLDVEFQAGMPAGADGSMRLADGPCATSLTFTDLLLPTTPDGYPVGVILLDADAGADHVEGSLTLDGTSTALLQASLNDGAPEVHTIDLATGTVL